MTDPTTPATEPTLREMLRVAINTTRNAAHTARHGDNPELTKALNIALEAILNAGIIQLESED